jgi:hypothetical protein
MSLPNIHAMIKASSGDAAIADGTVFHTREPRNVTLKYIVVNESDVAVGPFTVVGMLSKNKQRVMPDGVSNVVPAQEVTLAPQSVWKKEYELRVEPKSDGGLNQYRAYIICDAGNRIEESNEYDNTASFNVGAQY